MTVTSGYRSFKIITYPPTEVKALHKVTLPTPYRSPSPTPRLGMVMIAPSLCTWLSVLMSTSTTSQPVAPINMRYGRDRQRHTYIMQSIRVYMKTDQLRQGGACARKVFGQEQPGY